MHALQGHGDTDAGAGKETTVPNERGVRPSLWLRSFRMAELTALRARLRELGRVVVAFSGGADSALLAWMAHDTLGADGSHAVTAVSPSLAGLEHDDCRALAREWGLRWSGVPTTEMEDAAYRVNDRDRCARCKSALMDALGPIAVEEGATVVLGVNVDDLGEDRPGQWAALEQGAVFPLVDCGFSKADVRQASEALGLRTWDKPAAPCLASRVPHGTPVTVAVLGRVERAEAGLRSLGLRELRVRHHGDRARVELAAPDLAVALDRRDEVIAAVRGAGYRHVEIHADALARR